MQNSKCRSRGTAAMASGNSGGSEEKGAASSAGAVSPSPGGSKLVMILSLVNLIATLGMLGLLFISFQKESHHASVDDIAAHAAPSSDGEHGKGKSEEGKSEGHGEGGHKEESKKKSMDFGKMVTLEQFTVNLSTPGSANPKFVRVNISLEVPTEDTEVEVNSKMPQVRNTIIDLFNSKRPSDLATVDGREYLKDEIRNALNTFLVNGKIKGVFFTSFALAG
jgi:flagellar FliL protein